MPIQSPAQRVTVAEARSRLPRLLHAVERGQAVEITRRGQPVAVVVSLADYRRISGKPGDAWEAYERWSASVDAADRELPDDFFSALRDRSPGRGVRL
jgi:cellobiose PTS system EIIB component